MRHIVIGLAGLIVIGCGGMAVDELPEGGVDGTHSSGAMVNGEGGASSEETGEVESAIAPVTDKWCIGCLAGVSAPQNIEFGYGLRPITETIGGRLTQFPACQGTESNMPHACRTPTGKAVFFGPPPSHWATSRKNAYWGAVNTVGAELSNAGWAWVSGQNGNPDPWDTGNNRYQHTEVLVKNEITNSPYPLGRLTLQGVQNTPKPNLKTYLACEIEFDLEGPLGMTNNGGHCGGTPHCTQTWAPQDYEQLRKNIFTRMISRCVGLGGDQLPIHEYPVGDQLTNCWAINQNFTCAAGGGDGMMRKEWFADGWWSQKFWKNCQGNSPSAACSNTFAQPIGVAQFLSGSILLWGYTH
jgi:hypothetical protein